MKVIQVGYGYWGANITKKLLISPRFELKALCEILPERAEKARQNLPDDVIVSDDYTRFLSDPEIEGYIIATQTENTFSIGMNAMNYGKHVFMEKPIATTVERTEKLIARAKEKKVIMHCDHIMLYNPYYRYIKQLIDNGELGDLYYYDTDKINLGPIRTDVNAMMDLAVHDIAVIDWISSGKLPKMLSVIGEIPYGKQEALTNLIMKYDNFTAHLKSSWIAPTKVRKTVIGGSKKIVVFDDMLPEKEKVKIYDYGIDVIGDENDPRSYVKRTGDIYTPEIPFEDSLQASLEFFEHCTRTGEESRSGPTQCLRVMKVLEWAQSELEKQHQH